MDGVDGIAPPLRDSESPVPLLYETPLVGEVGFEPTTNNV